jgi:hypothetical protein
VQELSRLLASPMVDAAQARRLLEKLEPDMARLNNVSVPEPPSPSSGPSPA